MCSRCIEAAAPAASQRGDGGTQCQACRARAARSDFALRRDRIVWGELLDHSFTIYRRHVWQVTLATLVALSPFVFGQVASYAVSGLFENDFLLAMALSLLLW